MVDISVVTPTFNRKRLLASVLEDFRTQSLGELKAELIAVHDGPKGAGECRAVCQRMPNVRFFHTEQRTDGYSGATVRDFGIKQAQGQYLCFWDDDNIYFPHALATMYAIAHGHDLGIAQVLHVQQNYRAVPSQPALPFRYGNIDTACYCVRRELALEAPGFDDGRKASGTDFRWGRQVEKLTSDIRVVPIVIGVHV